MNDNQKSLAKMHLHEETSMPGSPLNKTSTIAQLIHLKSQSADHPSGSLSPTLQSNLLTVSFTLNGQSDQRQVSEKSFKSRNTRRNSSLIDKQTLHQKRRSSKTETNTNASLTSSAGSILLQQKNNSVERVRQKTFDSFNESISNIDCKQLILLLFSSSFYSNLIS